MRKLPSRMREKVLASVELFADHGLDATRTEDVASTTGIPEATLYSCFDGKADILVHLRVCSRRAPVTAASGRSSTPAWRRSPCSGP